MKQLCKTIWEKSPSISCRYQIGTTVHPNRQEKSPLATMNTEGQITLPLILVAGAMVAVSIPCICCICCKKKRKCRQAD